MEKAGELFELSHKNLLAFAASIVRNQEDAQDVVQEVFMECVSVPKRDIDRAYLFKAVKNRSFNKLRGKKRFLNAIEKFGAFLLFSERDHGQEENLRHIVETMPAKYRDVLILRMRAELKNAEIAEVLDIPVGTVKSRINKAVKIIKAYY